MAETSAHVLATAILSALLLVASASDLRARRIPNAIVVATLALGVLEALAGASLSGGLIAALGGLLVGLVIWMPLHMLGMVGAGDVKLAAAAGLWLGARGTLEAAVATAIIGGVLAVLLVVHRRSVRMTAMNLGVMFAAMSRGRFMRAPEVAASTGTVPYGVAIAIGVLLVAWR